MAIKLLKRTQPQIEPEALFAYMSRLPKQIEVSWKREDGLFVGLVKYDDFSFVTQGIDHQVFINMVSESVLVSLGIPSRYVNYLMGFRPIFEPNQEALKELRRNNTGTFRIISKLKDRRAYA